VGVEACAQEAERTVFVVFLPRCETGGAVHAWGATVLAHGGAARRRGDLGRLVTFDLACATQVYVRFLRARA